MDNKNVLTEDQVKEFDPKELLEESSRQLVAERKHQAANLIKSLLNKIEDLTYSVKIKKRELERAESGLKEASMKIAKLRKGDWSVLLQNQRATKVDSVKEPGSDE